MAVLNDSDWKVDTSVPYAQERGTTFDIIHDIYAGAGDALELIGRGVGSETIQGAGEAIQESSFARPDISQYYGTDSRVGRVVDGIARSLPTTAALGGATAVGALAGPVGAGAAFTGGLGVIGHGTFDQSMEEIRKERPDLDPDEQFKYAAINGFSEAGSEALGWLIPFGIGKSVGKGLSKVATKRLATSLVDAGVMTSDQVVATTIKKLGAKESIAGLFGGAVSDGTSEVANELVQSANRESVGMDSTLPDLIDVFLIGSAPGGVIAGGIMARDASIKSKVRQKLSDGLTSEDLGTRMKTLDTISMGLSNIDPEIGEAYKSNMLDKVQAGPVSLETPVGLASEDIINNPEASLQEEGIPTNSDPIAIVEPTSSEPAQEAVVPNAPNGIGVQGDLLSTPLQVPEEVSIVDAFKEVVPVEDPVRYQEGLKAMKVPAQRAAVIRGMKEVEEDARKMYSDTSLNLRDWSKISKRIEKNRKLIDEEMDKVLGPKAVAEEPKVTAKKPEAVKEPKVTIKEPEVAATEPEVTVEEPKVAVKEPVATKEPVKEPVATKEPKVTVKEPVATKEPKVVEEPKVTTEESVPVEDRPLTKEQLDAAGTMMEQGVSIEHAMALAKKNVTKVDKPMEAIRETDNGKFKRAEWTDGTIVEDQGGTKDKRFAVMGKDKQWRRVPSLKVAKKAIEEGTVDSLELYENKTTRKKKTDGITRPLTDAEKEAVADYMLSKPDIAKGIRGGDEVLPVALTLEMSAKGKLTDAGVKKRIQQLIDKKQNETDAAKMSKAGLSRETVSFDTLLNEEEDGGITDAMDDIEAEDIDATPSEDVADEDQTQYSQEGKGKYEVFKQWVEPDGKKVSAAKRSKDAKSFLATRDKRFVLNTIVTDGKVSVELWKDGENTGEVFNNPEEAMEWAKESDRVEQSPSETIAEASKEAFGLEEAVKKLKEVEDPSADVQEAIKILEKEVPVKEKPKPRDLAPMSPAERMADDYKKLFGLQKGIVKLLEQEQTSEVQEAVNLLQQEREAAEGKSGEFAKRYPNGLVTLQKVLKAETSSNTTRVLAKFLLDNVSGQKLEGIVIKLGKKNSHRDGVITLKESTSAETKLHEIVHAITVRELGDNAEFSKKVTSLREQVLSHAIENELLAKDEIEALRGAKTSEDFMLDRRLNSDLAYGLLNDKEFLAMAYSSKMFQTILKDFKIEKKSLWSRLVSFVAKALGLGKDYTMLEEVISVVPEVAKQKGKDTGEVSLEKEDSRVPKTDEEVAAIMAGKGPKEKFKEKLFEKGKDLKTFAENAVRPLSDRIEARSKKIGASLMKMETKLIMKQKEYSNKVKPFMTWYKGLTESQRTRYDLALMNSNTKENQEILKEIPTSVMKKVKEVLEDLRQRAEDVGLGTEDKAFYFPRRVHDVEGLVEHMNKDSKYNGPIAVAFKEEMQKLGVKELTEDQKTQVITDVLQRGFMRQLPRPGASKKRTVPFVDRGSYEFYSNSNDSLMGHIYEMNEKIGQREFIGGSTRKKKIQELLKDMRKINKMEDGPERRAAIAEYDVRAMELEDLEKDLSDGVSALIYNELGTEPAHVQNEVIDLINARMRQRGASGIIDFMRNVGYAATMGNFLSAITQLGDIGILFYANGLNKDSFGAVATALKNVKKIVQEEMHGKRGESDAFVDQADFTNQLREFSTSSMSAEAVDKLFQLSGLKYSDLIGKEAFMQAAYKKYQRSNQREKFIKKYEPMFGDKTKEVWQKFQLGKKTDEDVLTVLISELSEFQPVTLSQQSKMYLEGGSARVFWMLKTFTMRATSAAIREGVKEINKGNTAKGVGKIVMILAIYSAAGASADELKDLIRGKESSFKDSTIDNMLQMLFMSKYSLSTGVSKGAPLKTLIAENLIPPVRYADDFITDVGALTGFSGKEFKAKSLRAIPFIGNIAYGRVTGYASQEREAILNMVKKNKKNKRGAYANGLSERINKYNASVSSEKITSSTVLSAYKGA